MKEECKKLNYLVQEKFNDRDTLKFAAADEFDIPKAAANLIDHLKWLASFPPRIVLTPAILKLMHSGCYYIFGRDKYYRPCVIQDIERIVQVMKSDPDLITVDNFTNLYAFHYEYCMKVMMLPGQVETWMHIVNMGHLSMSALPTDLVIPYSKFMQIHSKWHLAKSFYV